MPPGLPSAVDSVLDVGCGIRPQDIVKVSTYIGVDAHKPYIERARVEHPDLIFLHGCWDDVLPHFKADSFDVVVALDFIEHLERDDGLRFLEEMQRLGRYAAVFTPSGPLEQSYEAGEPDAWGMNGGHWQTHRSAWRPEDFLGWEVEVLPNFHVERGCDAFWAVKDGMEA